MPIVNLAAAPEGRSKQTSAVAHVKASSGLTAQPTSARFIREAAFAPGEPQWIIRKDGKRINLEEARSRGIDYLKLQNYLDELSRQPRVDGQRIQRLQAMLYFVLAETKQERAELLKRMGVTVTVTPPSDGRAGQMLHFIVGGKLRRQMYLPPHQRQEIEDEVRSGPSAVDDIDYLGRWKDDGHGGCYWDPNDDGPDQCEPSGGGMVCYHEGQPSECSTEEEEAEFVALIAASEAEVEGYEEDYYDADDALDQYCSQNPWDCQQPAPLANLGGPSACNDPTLSFARCTSEAFEATGAFASHVAAIAGAEGALADAVAAGTRLSTATRLSWAGVLATTAFGAGYFVGSFVNCVFNVVVVPEAELLSLIQPSEPRAGQEFGSASIHAGLNGVMASGRP